MGDMAETETFSAIRSSNLFLIPLDTHGDWFRYHHLFADLLRVLLQRDYPDLLTDLHLKASAWFASEGLAYGFALESLGMVRI
jgi:LuxR family maltose regulon positive regulatory protein